MAQDLAGSQQRALYTFLAAAATALSAGPEG